LKSAGPTAARDYFKDNVVAPVAEHPFTVTLEGCVGLSTSWKRNEASLAIGALSQRNKELCGRDIQTVCFQRLGGGVGAVSGG
jgi:hypothetical protein